MDIWGQVGSETASLCAFWTTEPPVDEWIGEGKQALSDPFRKFLRKSKNKRIRRGGDARASCDRETAQKRTQNRLAVRRLGKIIATPETAL